jgi:hypothetical protein
MTREQNRERDKNRPVIVHCIALLVQSRAHCDDDDAVQAAWDIWDYLGRPDQVPEQVPEVRPIYLQDVR